MPSMERNLFLHHSMLIKIPGLLPDCQIVCKKFWKLCIWSSLSLMIWLFWLGKKLSYCVLFWYLSANLGNSYFSNRLDKYIALKDHRLADYYELVSDVCRTLTFFSTQPMKFILVNIFLSKKRIMPLHPSKLLIICSNSKLYDMDSNYRIFVDTFKRFEYVTPMYSELQTSYLTFPRSFAENLHRIIKSSTLKLITSSETSNGFFGSSGIKILIPKLYEASKYSIFNEQLQDNFILLEFARPNWTFHGKGLFFQYLNSSVLVFGSSNFGITLFLVMFVFCRISVVLSRCWESNDHFK